MYMPKERAQSFMRNVLTVLFSQVAIKLLGFLYRVVITNIDGFQDVGNGYYNYGYQVYTLLLAISSVGIPNAIAKLVSEKCAKDDFASAYRVFKCALALFSVLGGALSLFLFIFSQDIATKICGVPKVVYTLRVLSPAILFVSVSSVIRGFFQGMQDMKATSASQVIEQLIKCVSTIVIVLAIAGAPPEYMAAGATMATTLSTALSLIYLFWFYRARSRDIKLQLKRAPKPERQTFLRIARSILFVSIPISLGSIIAGLNRVIDLLTIVRGLTISLASNFTSSDALSTEIMRLSGILSKSDVIINLPLALNIAFSTVLVPTVAGALALGDRKTAQEKVSFSLLVSIIIALPASLGCIVLSDEIFRLIYPGAPDGGALFAMSAVTIFFSAITQTNSGSLQGMGKIFVPAVGLLLGGIAKVAANLILIPIPAINIYGAPIGSILCQVIACAVTFFIMKKHLGVTLGFKKYLAKPLAASLLMAATAYFSLKLFRAFLPSSLSTLLAIAAACIVYGIFVFVIFKIFSDEELKSLPFGKKLIKFSHLLK